MEMISYIQIEFWQQKYVSWFAFFRYNGVSEKLSNVSKVLELLSSKVWIEKQTFRFQIVIFFPALARDLTVCSSPQ